LIRHIVMWNVRGGSPAEKEAGVERLRRSFHSLRGRVPGLLHLEIGIDRSAVDYACDVVLVSDFESQAALDAYATHPEHLRVKAEIGDIRTHRYQVDYRIGSLAPSPAGGEGRGEDSAMQTHPHNP
jgi:quinol monooxygenase YgiN